MKDLPTILLIIFIWVASWLPGFSRSYTATEIAGFKSQDRARWSKAEVNSSAVRSIDQALNIFERNKARYEAVSKYGAKPIPPIIIFLMHYRESDASFRCHASNGDPLDHRTRNVPRGRLAPPASPTFTWEATAIDAYYICDKLGGVNWSDMGDALYAITSFNGLGYYGMNLPSAYTWSKTNQYSRGKYVSDGRFDRMAVDGQIGCAAILLRYMQLHNLKHL